MIVSQYYTSYQEGANLYVRHRDKDGGLIEQHITPEDYRPYFWVKNDDYHENLFRRIKHRYPGSELDRSVLVKPLPDGTGYDDATLMKVVVESPSDIKKMREEFPRTWEADVRFEDRWLIDNVPEMPDWKPVVMYFDIEAVYVDEKDKEEMTTVICCWLNDDTPPVTFCWREGQERERRFIDRVEGYECRYHGSEAALHEDFLQWFEDVDPDVLVAHAANFFDIPHLIRRLENYKRLSPVHRVRQPAKNSFFDDTDQPITGRIVFDTAARGMSGSGFERVWMDSGKGKLPNRKLDTIAKELGMEGKFDVNAADWTIWEGTHPEVSFDDYVDYCVQDVRLLRRIDEQLHALDLYLALQKFCGVCFSSTHNVSNFARGLLSRRVPYKAPTRIQMERHELKGAHIPDPVPGRYDNVACVDYKGLYMSIVDGLNLDYTTLLKEGDYTPEDIISGKVKMAPNGTAWRQDKEGYLPAIVREMFALRGELKKNMRDAKTEEERSGWNTFQMAVKRVMASMYGMTASAGYGWGNITVAQTITSVGREAIHLLLRECESLGYNPVFGHTDSAYVQVPMDKVEWLSGHLSQRAQEKLSVPTLEVEWESYFPYFTIAKKNRYFGVMSYPEEDAGKLKVSGYEYKASHAAPISKQVQGKLFNMVSTGAEEHEVTVELKLLVQRILKGEFDVNEVTCWNRITKNPNQYEIHTMASRAAAYYNEHNGKDPYRRRDDVAWVYVAGVPEGQPSTPVVAYRDEKDLEGYTLDRHTMVKKLIQAKAKSAYDEALGWDSSILTAKSLPRGLF